MGKVRQNLLGNLGFSPFLCNLDLLQLLLDSLSLQLLYFDSNVLKHILLSFNNKFVSKRETILNIVYDFSY